MERFGDGAFPLLALFVASAAMLAAQDASQSGAQQNPYQGVSHPPADDTIITTSIPEPKPPAGQPMNPQPMNAQPQYAPPPPPHWQYTQSAPAPMPPAEQYEPRATS